MNGRNGNGRVIMWLAGILVTLVLFIGFPTLVKAVVKNDENSRARDLTLMEAQHKTELQTRDRFEQIMIELAKIQTKLDGR